MDVYKFTRQQLEEILGAIVGKTLGQVDTKNVFARTIKSPKITGIAGDVIEQSVLGYPPNSSQRPDIIVDGIETEVKTTGIRVPKKKDTGFMYEAKEPISVTAVSPNAIVKEEFESSNFWHKLEHLLLVYYLYDSPVTVLAADYANFPIKGYHFHEFSEEEKQMLKNDWIIVRDFIRYLQENYTDLDKQYPRISSELRKQLMLIDTAPKWPNKPRFRLKRPVVSTIVQKHFGAQLEQLSETYASFKELDDKLHNLTTIYRDKTVRQLIDMLDINVKLSSKGDVSKGIAEQIIIKMFGGTANKISKIELFSKVGLMPRTIVQTKTGARTEDTKLFKIDFPEWLDPDLAFEESFIYNYFSAQQFLCILFQEPSADSLLLDNTFIGFKRLVVSDELIYEQVKPLWDNVRDLVNNNKLVETVILDKNSKPQINKNTGTEKVTLNFPKSKDYTFFIRGSGTDSTKKNFELNGIKMYTQYVWMKGSVLNDMLAEVDFI